MWKVDRILFEICQNDEFYIFFFVFFFFFYVSLSDGNVFSNEIDVDFYRDVEWN